MNYRIAAELAHLIRLAETNLAWQEYSIWKSKAMALKTPAEMNELPLLLSNALDSRKFGPKRPSIQPRSK